MNRLPIPAGKTGVIMKSTRRSGNQSATHYIEALASTRFLLLVDRLSGNFETANWEHVVAVGPDMEETKA